MTTKLFPQLIVILSLTLLLCPQLVWAEYDDSTYSYTVEGEETNLGFDFTPSSTVKVLGIGREEYDNFCSSCLRKARLDRTIGNKYGII